jgi:nucleotide-binding universal stress UspA family protein
MFQSILVPLDGTPFAEAALLAAARVARSARARLHLLLAHQPTAALVGMGEVVAPNQALDQAMREQEQTYLVEIITRAGQADVPSITTSRVEGPAGDAICEEVSRIGADLIVMATHGRSALGRLWLGSVSNHVIRHSGVPVLLIHPNRVEKAFERQSGAGILVALDLSPFSEAVLEPVAQLACLLQAHITLLHVVEPNYYTGETATPYPLEQDATITDVRRADAQRRLDDLTTRLRARGLSAAARVIIEPNAAAAVLQTLGNQKYDMVAMTTHGIGGMRRLFLGSVADKVVRSAGKPVLILRPGPAPGE